MNISPMRIAAAVCVVVALLVMLFAPCISMAMFGGGLSGVRLLQISAWMLVPIVVAVIMAACCLLISEKVISAVIVGVGAFVPLLTVAIFKGQVSSMTQRALGSSYGGFASGLVGSMIVPGIAVYAFLILSLVAVVLVLLSDGTPSGRNTNRTGGIEKNEFEEW